MSSWTISFRFALPLLLILTDSAPLWASSGFPQVRTTSFTTRVVDVNGAHVCSLPQGSRVQPIGRDSESENIQVRPGTNNCPVTGIVRADDIDFEPGSAEATEMQTNRQNVNFRLRPSLAESARAANCLLPAGTKMNLTSDQAISNRVTFYPVKLQSPPPGCPSDGYVAANMLEDTDAFERLPEYKPGDPRRQSETRGACPECAERGGQSQTGRELRRAIRRGDEQTRAARALTSAARRGVGHVGRNLCYRAVKRIIAAARIPGIDASKVTGGSAIDAMHALKAAGFTNTHPGGCNVPGAILVYEGAAHRYLSAYRSARTSAAKAAVKRQARQFMLRQGSRYSEGDLHGHIEILGTDGRYHHFVSSRSPVTRRFGDRRKLKGCFLKQ